MMRWNRRYYMNRGDTLYIQLDYTVNDEPLIQNDWDEIEFSFGDKQYSLSNGDIVWDNELEKYCVFIDQEDTFALKNFVTHYQIRLKKDGEVISDNVKPFAVGKVISRKVI